MNQFFFGSAERPLYGVHHEPSVRPSRKTAILLAYPFGREYMRCHRALVRLCDRFAADGYHCLRFDYHGTGDSAGASGEGNAEEWVANTRAAAAELRELSGADSVCLVGVRLGAAIAMLAAAAEPAVSGVVLWDPVVRGDDYIDSLEALHSAFIHDTDRFPEAARLAAGADELVGMICPPGMRESIRHIDLTALPRIPASFVSIIASAHADETKRLQESLEAHGTTCRYEIVNERVDWDALAQLGVVLTPHALLAGLRKSVLSACA